MEDDLDLQPNDDQDDADGEEGEDEEEGGEEEQEGEHKDDEHYEHDHTRLSIDYTPSEADDEEHPKKSRASTLADLAEEDAREFDDADMEDFLPKSKFKDKSFLKLREFFENIIADLENAQKNGIPLEEVKEEFYFVWNAVQKSHENLNSLLHKDLQLSVNCSIC